MLYEINLLLFKVPDFYEGILEIVYKNYGWINYQKAIFNSEEERNNCLMDFELLLGFLRN